MSTEKHIGESQMKGTPGKRFTFIIGDEAVKEKHLAPKAVTPSKLDDSTLEKIQQMIDASVKDLQNQIDGYNQHGIAVSSQLGDDPYISVSQKYLTECFNKIWEKLDDITGEQSRGIVMTVNPEYFISEEGADVQIYASAVDIEGIFETIAFYKRGLDQEEWELIKEESETDHLSAQTFISTTSEIKCVAKILGIEYIKTTTITHYNSFFLGAGISYADLMIDDSHFNPEYVIPITDGMRGAYDVEVGQGEKIIIIIGDSLNEGFIRADMNGFEIPFVESTITVSGNAYKVFTSENAYNAGIYNIDING